jgi:hypothetical protein
MISVELKGNFYSVKFRGKKNQFTEYINKIMSITTKQYNFEDKCWMIPKQELTLLQSKFKDIEYLEEVFDIVKKKVIDYGDIGKQMKLQPFEYQKEAIKFAVDNKNALIIFPCGSGKLCI